MQDEPSGTPEIREDHVAKAQWARQRAMGIEYGETHEGELSPFPIITA